MNILNIVLFLGLVAFSVIFSSFAKNKSRSRKKELFRKIPHILIGIIFSLGPIFMSRNEIILASLFLVLGILIGKYIPHFKVVFSIKRITYGMWLTPLSLGIMSFL
jgi:hypothetical protein